MATKAAGNGSRGPTSPGAALLTEVAVVVHEDDLVEKPGRRAVQDAAHRPEQCGQGLVVEADDDAGHRQVGRVLLVLTPAEEDRELQQGMARAPKSLLFTRHELLPGRPPPRVVAVVLEAIPENNVVSYSTVFHLLAISPSGKRCSAYV